MKLIGNFNFFLGLKSKMKTWLFVIIFSAFPYAHSISANEPVAHSVSAENPDTYSVKDSNAYSVSAKNLNANSVSVKKTLRRRAAVQGDYNFDGKVDSKDSGILYWLFSRRNLREVEDQPSQLEIERFTASPRKISGGETATLRWSVKGLPESLVINNKVGNVKGRSSVRVNPARTTTYTLTARNSLGSATAEVKVDVVPQIVSFTASRSVIRGDENSTLRWRISGYHTCVEINNGLGEVTGQTSVQVASAGTYILKVFYSTSEQPPCSGSFISRSLTINGPPNIVFFRASPPTIRAGGITTLSWSIRGEVTQVSMDHGVGDVSDITTLPAAPDSTTTYTLTAVNDYGSSVKTVEVRVDGDGDGDGDGEVPGIPVIEFFRANLSLVNRIITAERDELQLQWRVSGSGPIRLNVKQINSDGRRTDVSSCRNLSSTRTSCHVYPSETTSYILTASNSLGEAESDIATVGVLKLNAPDPAFIVEGGSSQLSWEGSEYAEILELENREGRTGNYGSAVDVAGSDSYEVSPSVTTYYRLKARAYDSDRFIYAGPQVVRIGEVASFSAAPPFVVKFDNPAVHENTKTTEGNTRLSWDLAEIANPRTSVLQTVDGVETDITSSCRSSGCTVTPGDTATTYTLRVRANDNVDLQSQITVNILKIARFKGSLGSRESTYCALRNSEAQAAGDDAVAVECFTAADGQSVNLSWEGFSGYNSLVLETCQLDSVSDSSCSKTTQTVTNDADKSISVSPSGYSTVYTLLARKVQGNHSKTIKLKVRVLLQDDVQINVFSADDLIIKQGSSDQSARLEWDIAGKDPVTFELFKEPAGENQTRVWERESPRSSKQSYYTYSFAGSSNQKTTEFTLTADNNFGSEASRKVKVYYLKMGSFTATAGSSNTSSATGCSGADHCLTVTSGTEVALNWDPIEGFEDERASSCGASGQPKCIRDTLEITWDKDSFNKIRLADTATSQTLSGLSNSNRIERAPSSTAVYTLTAKKQVGSETESLSKTIKIIVQDVPSISSFTARAGTSDSSDLNRIVKGASENTYLQYTHTGKDPYNLKIEQKPEGESSFTTGDGFNQCASDGGPACKNYRRVTPTKTTEYKLTLEKPTGTSKDTRTIRVYKLGVGSFKAQTSNTNKSTATDCGGADECLTVVRNENIQFSWDGITGFEAERSGDLVQITSNNSDACSSTSYQDNSNPSSSGSVTFSASGIAGTCQYTLRVQKTLGSGDDEETEKIEKTITVAVNNPASVEYFESRVGDDRDNDAINRIIQNSGNTTLLWKVFSASDSNTWELKTQEEDASAASFEPIDPTCTDSTVSPSFTECSHPVSTINKTTTFTFRVTLSGGQKITSSPLKVYVLKVDSFKGVRTLNARTSIACTGEPGECISIERGDVVRLEWMIEGFGGEGTDTLEITPSVQTGHGLPSCTGNPCKMNVKGRSNLRFNPTATTIYTLTAKKVIGSDTETDSKKVKVTLARRPEITTFKAVQGATDPLLICKERCGDFKIRWAVSHDPTKVTITAAYTNNSGVKVEECINDRNSFPDNCESRLTDGGGYGLDLRRTTQYTIKAENALGNVSRNIKVKVFRVKEYTRTPRCIPSGGSAQLAWKVAEGINGADSVTITPGVGRDPAVGNQSSTCSDDRHGIERVCTGRVSVSPDLGGDTFRWAPYHLTAKKPTGVANDISSSASCDSTSLCVAVGIGTPIPACSPSGSIEPPKVSGLFQECRVCPKMAGWSSLNISKMLDFSLANSVREPWGTHWIGNSQRDLEPYLQAASLQNKTPFNTDSRTSENKTSLAAEKLAAEQASISPDNSTSTSTDVAAGTEKTSASSLDKAQETTDTGSDNTFGETASVHGDNDSTSGTEKTSASDLDKAQETTDTGSDNTFGETASVHGDNDSTSQERDLTADDNRSFDNIWKEGTESLSAESENKPASHPNNSNLVSSENEDSSLGNTQGYSISVDKITHSEYQACVDEGFCSPLSFQGTVPSFPRTRESSESGEIYEPLVSSSQGALSSSSSFPRTRESSESGEIYEPLVSSSQGALSSSSSFPRTRESSESGEIEDSPVSFVSLNSAMEYARWLSEKTDRAYGVLADPNWIDDRLKNSSNESTEEPISLSPLYNQDGVLLYGIHSKKTLPSAAYEGLIEDLLASEQINHVSDIAVLDVSVTEDETAVDESAGNNSSSAEGLSSIESEIVFQSGFHVIRSL